MLVMQGLAALALATSAAAQTSLQVPLQFDFINPGAKSLALGGAFSGLADDATATFANPAGLTELGASEVSFEVRRSRLSTPFLESGRLSGAIFNQGIDTVRGAIFANSVGTDAGIGFAAGVYVHPSRRWVVAGYRHELVRTDQSFLSLGVFQQAPGEVTSRRDPPQLGDRALQITGYGAAAAYKPRPNVSVGATLTMYVFDFDSVFRRFDTDGFLGAPLLNVELSRQSQRGSDVGFAPTFGVIVGEGSADPAASWLRRSRLGIVFKGGPGFSYTTTIQNGASRDERFRVPHTLALGASVRLRPQLTTAVEVTRVVYSRIREDFVIDQAQDVGREADFTIDDGTEVHVGVQYAMPSLKGLPRLRAGSWFDPDHSVRFSPTLAQLTVSDVVFDERLATALSRGASQVHLTGGLGLTLHRRLELNVGADVSKHQTRLSTSLIVR
jgi:hypothetical protein